MNAEEEFFRKASMSSKQLPPSFHEAAEKSSMAADIAEIRKSVQFIATVVLAWVVLSILAAAIVIMERM